LEVWIEAKRRWHLSDAQVQMAREMGMNPKRFGKLANTDQEQWKVLLPRFIEELYLKRFKKPLPDNVRSIRQIAEDHARKKLERRERKRLAGEAETEHYEATRTSLLNIQRLFQPGVDAAELRSPGLSRSEESGLRKEK
jgi:hypothetical protein